MLKALGEDNKREYYQLMNITVIQLDKYQKEVVDALENELNFYKMRNSEIRSL